MRFETDGGPASHNRLWNLLILIPGSCSHCNVIENRLCGALRVIYHPSYPALVEVASDVHGSYTGWRHPRIRSPRVRHPVSSWPAAHLLLPAWLLSINYDLWFFHPSTLIPWSIIVWSLICYLSTLINKGSLKNCQIWNCPNTNLDTKLFSIGDPQKSKQMKVSLFLWSMMKDLWPMINDVWSLTQEDPAKIYDLKIQATSVTWLQDLRFLRNIWLPQMLPILIWDQNGELNKRFV